MSTRHRIRTVSTYHPGRRGRGPVSKREQACSIYQRRPASSQTMEISANGKSRGKGST